MAYLHQICTTCSKACEQSVILRSPAIFSLSGKERFAFDADTTRFPYSQSMRDANPWNSELPYVFENEIPHHETAINLEASGAKGCHLCSLFWHHISAERYGILKTQMDQEQHRLAEESREVARRKMRKCSLQLFVRFFIDDITKQNYTQFAGAVLYAGSHSNGLPEIRSTLRVWPTRNLESLLTFKFRDSCFATPNMSTASEQTISQAKKWLQDCQTLTEHGKSHYLCSAASESEFSWPTPTRLLDLSGSETVYFYTNSSPEKSSTVKYACLSHCWGGANVLKLEQNNLNKFKNEGVPVSNLPKTYQDAIDITRRLGIQYLWIDSLCIIQDSVEDWREEASKMAEVYSCATVTVAALAARNSHDGCYYNYNPLSYWPCVLPGVAAGVSLTAWCGREWPFHNERLPLSPLLQRGWVMQERCLGKRILYFGRFGIYWECATMRADEVFAGGFAHDGLGNTGDELTPGSGEILVKAVFNRRLFLVGQDMWSFPIHIKVDELGEGRRVHPFVAWKFLGYWYNVVDAYSRTNLTFSKDKLVAFGGIIKLVQQRTAMTSLAGLWRELILDDLLWSSADPISATRLPNYRAPTFSWASLDGRIYRSFHRLNCTLARNIFLTEHSGIPHSADEQYLATVVSDRVETIGPSKHIGEVQSAELTLKGYPIRYKSSKIPLNDKSGYRWSHPCANLRESPSSWMELDVEADGSDGSIDVVLLPIIGWSNGNAPDREGKECDSSDTRESKGEMLGEGLHVVGLVLHALPDRNALFRRIGIFEICGGSLKPNFKVEETLTLV